MDLLKAIEQHPDKIEVRLAYSVLYPLWIWEIDQFLKESWRWN